MHVDSPLRSEIAAQGQWVSSWVILLEPDRDKLVDYLGPGRTIDFLLRRTATRGWYPEAATCS